MQFRRREFLFGLPLSWRFLWAPVTALIARCSSSYNREDGVMSCDNPGTASTDVSTNGENNLLLCLNTYTDLKNIHGSYRLKVRAATGMKTISVTRTSATDVSAVSAICTHQNCTLGNYNSAARTFTCPCHGSIFNGDGTVSSGPAVKDLPSYAATLNSGDVTVAIP